MAALLFVSGVFTGAGLLSVMSFTGGSDPPTSPPVVTPITLPDANANFRRYYNGAEVAPTPFKGFYVDTVQIRALSQLHRLYPSLPGFRVYMGRDLSNASVSVVVGVDSRGLDLTSNTMYMTSSLVRSGPCPFVCDQQSPITRTD